VLVQLLGGFVDARGKHSKPLEIAAVTFQGVIGKPALDPQMREIRVDEIVSG
jgi:hypothetical protein